MDKMRGFGARLAKAMQDSGINGPELGRHLGVERQTITNWKKDRNFPKADQMYALCRKLGVPSDYLLFDLAQPLSLPAIRLATRYDKLMPSQKSQWERLVDVVEARPVEIAGDDPQQESTPWISQKPEVIDESESPNRSRPTTSKRKAS